MAADYFDHDGFRYSTTNMGEVSMGNINEAEHCKNALLAWDQACSTLKINSTINHNGDHYKVTAIVSNAFCKIQDLTSVFIPNTIEEIGGAAFTECTSLKQVTFEQGSKLKAIYNRAFAGLPNLESIIIPPSVNNITQLVFANYSILSHVIYCGRSTFLTKNLIHPAEDAVNNDLKIFVVQGLYKASRFGNMSVIFTSECLVDPSIKGHLLTCRSKGWHFSFVYFVVVLL